MEFKMRKFILVMVLLLSVSGWILASSLPEEIQALLDKESSGIQLTKAEKSIVADYFAQNPIPDPWMDTSWGTDGWYEAVDQFSGGQPFNWIDISVTGTELWPNLNQDDTWSSAIALPFTFPYYWTTRDSIRISANVILCFDNQTTPSYSLAVPSNTGQMKIDPWAYDMYHLGADTAIDGSAYYYQGFGDSLFVVQFRQARYYSSTVRYDPTYGKDLEVLLYSDGRVVFQYDTLRSIYLTSPNNSGLEDSVGTAGITCGNSFTDGQAITFTPLTGVILSGGQVNPPTGNTSTNFEYMINFRNTAALAPTTAQIFVDDVAYALVDSTGGAGDYYMGVPFYHTTTLAAGPHTYYFLFNYGGSDYRFPDAGYLDGPTVYLPFSGSYDVGGGLNDFTTIIEAIDALGGAGVSAAVTFNVYPGTYDGQVLFPTIIEGVNAENTITLQAVPGPRPVVINTAGSTTTTGACFRLEASDYITIKGFEITNCYSYGINVYYSGTDSCDYVTIEDNYIHDVAPSYSGYGMYVYRANYTKILNNEIQGDYYGINLSYCTYSEVSNNMVYGQDYYGIRNYAGSNNNYYYNSIYLNSDYGTTNYGFYSYNGANNEVKNNIIDNSGSGSTSKYAFYISGTLTTYPVASDYNDLYSPNSSVGYYSGAKTTLADWQTATGLDMNSVSGDPMYMSTTIPYNLHVDSLVQSVCSDAGTPIANVTVDFDYETRSETTPDIGADEFTMLFVPSIVLNMIPDSVVVTVPAGGGEFTYFAEIENTSAETLLVHLWKNVELPNGSSIDLYAVNLNLAPGAHLMRNCTQWVPAAAPEGTYNYMGYVADLSTWEILAETGFTFEKLAGDATPNHNNGWALLGWEDQSLLAAYVLPTKYEMHNNYPNPFNPVTHLVFDVPETGQISLVVYDINGREVTRLADGIFAPGSYQRVFDGSRLSSGIYFAVFRAGKFMKTNKMLLVK